MFWKASRFKLNSGVNWLLVWKVVKGLMAATKIHHLTTLVQSRGLHLKERMLMPCELLWMRGHCFHNYSFAKRICDPLESIIQQKQGKLPLWLLFNRKALQEESKNNTEDFSYCSLCVALPPIPGQRLWKKASACLLISPANCIVW